VTLAVDCMAPDSGPVGLDQTINYVQTYEIIKAAFEKPTALLETCALQISNSLQQAFTHLVRIDLSIRKLSPPITGFGGSVGVKYVKNFAPGPSPAEP
jgi:dihydroneopterin aldolase